VLGATHDCGPLGVNCLGPNDIPPSRLSARSDATVLRFSGYGEARLIPKFTIALGVRAQYAWKPLLSFEQFSAGNYTVGRGYDPGALLGDRGWGTQAEIRYGSRVAVSARRPAIEGYWFWDHAQVGHEDSVIVAGHQDLNSVGTGLRVNWNRFALDTGFAIPLNRVGPLNKRPGTRLLVSLTTRLWPWKY
jgi:hemolysin activation/secretion protein